MKYKALWSILAAFLLTMGCQEEPKPKAPAKGDVVQSAEGAKAKTEAETRALKAIPQDDPSAEKILKAMKITGEILNKYPTDPDAALREVRAYLDQHEAELKAAMADLRHRFDQMDPDAQEAYQTRNRNRPEYQLWAAACDAFENRFSDDKMAELEELMDRIQNEGAEQDTIEVEEPPSEPKPSEAAMPKAKAQGENKVKAESEGSQGEAGKLGKEEKSTSKEDSQVPAEGEVKSKTEDGKQSPAEDKVQAHP